MREAHIRAAYCFIDADLPWLRIPVDGVPALALKSLAKMLRRPGPLTTEQRAAMHRHLHEQFPPD